QSAFAGRFRGTASLQNRRFLAVSATNVAETGQKGEISGAGQPPPNPHRVRRGSKERIMPAKTLAARVRYQPGGAVIDLQGEINAFGSVALSDAYAEAERHNPDVVLLNFAGVDYINSTGIALIVGLLAKARAARRRLVVCGLSEHY